MWRKTLTILTAGAMLLALTTACDPVKTNDGQGQGPQIPAQRTDSCPLPVPGAGGPAAAQPGFFALQMEAHLYDGQHASNDDPLGDEVIKDIRPVSITIDGVAPDGDKADITFLNPVAGVQQKAPVTFSDCPPVVVTEFIKEGMVAVTWTVTMPVLTEGWTLSCLTRNAVPPQLIIHADRITAATGKIVNATVKCFWP